jgi:hypothetical protein
MILKRLGPLSLAKLAGFLYAVMGLIGGCVFALIAVFGGAVSQQSQGPVLGMLFGVGAIVFLPVLYGALGFLGSLLMAVLYNFAARIAGGIELELEPAAPSGVPERGV